MNTNEEYDVLVATPLGANNGNNVRAELRMVTSSTLDQRTEVHDSKQQRGVSLEEIFMHYIASGETLEILAKKYNTTIETLIMELTDILAGKTLQIPDWLKDLLPCNNGNYTIYTIRAGDSLWALAKKFNTTVEELLRLNNINAENVGNIYAGEKLLVPEVKNAQNSSSKIRSNLFVVVKSTQEVQQYYQNSISTTMGTFKIIVTSDIEIAYTEAQNYLGQNQVDNLVLSLYGITYTNSMTKKLNTSPDNTSGNQNVSAYNISNFINKTGANNTDQDNDVEALKNLMGMVKDGGNFVLTACKAAADLSLVQSISNLNPEVNLYMNYDETPNLYVNKVLQLWKGEYPLSQDSNGRNAIGQGWAKTSCGDLPTDLIYEQGQTGSIYIDPRKNASTPIVETIK